MKRLRGPHVHDQLELRGLLDGQVGGLGTSKDPVDVDGRSLVLLVHVRAEGHQHALLRVRSERRHGRQLVLDREVGDLSFDTRAAEWIHEEGVSSLAERLGEEGIERSGGVDLEGMCLQGQDRRGRWNLVRQLLDLGRVQRIEQIPTVEA